MKKAFLNIRLKSKYTKLYHINNLDGMKLIKMCIRISFTLHNYKVD